MSGKRWPAVAGVVAAAVAVSAGVLLGQGASAATGSASVASPPVLTGTGTATGTGTGTPATTALPAIAYLTGVSCPSAGTCLAAGLTAATGPSAVVRWNGHAWSALPSPGPAKDRLGAIWCASATSCLAVGDTQLTPSGSKQAALAERWNGTAWTVLPVPSPAPNAVQAYLTSIDCTSASSCQAVGTYTFSSTGSAYYALAEGWNGKAWRLEKAVDPEPKETQLNSVSCPAAKTCEAVGTGIEDGPLAEQWNGTAWTAQKAQPSAGGGPGGFGGVSCATATSCLAIGDTGGDDNQTLGESWNGHVWTYLPTLAPAESSDFTSVTCVSAANCLNVGGAGGDRGEVTLAARWNGKAWTVLNTPNAPPPAVDSNLDALSCASATACLAVGNSDRGDNTDPRGLAESWNGTSWTLLPTP